MSAGPSSTSQPPGAAFAPTQWSMVLKAGHHAQDGRAALESLCRAYWPPIHAHLRRLGHSAHDAQDLTQEFFSRLLSGDTLAGVDRQKGRFRSWLLGALKHFLINARRAASAQKRGGGHEHFSIDADDAMLHAGWEPRDDLSPDIVYDRQWAQTVLRRVSARMSHAYEAAGQLPRYTALRCYLPGDAGAPAYEVTADKLGLSPAAVKSAIYKIRQHYGVLLREEIAATVESPGDVEDEIRFFLTTLRQ
jgi:DNA-directed RNA polymerase specialized sigma24 family protein